MQNWLFPGNLGIGWAAMVWKEVEIWGDGTICAMVSQDLVWVEHPERLKNRHFDWAGNRQVGLSTRLRTPCSLTRGWNSSRETGSWRQIKKNTHFYCLLDFGSLTSANVYVLIAGNNFTFVVQSSDPGDRVDAKCNHVTCLIKILLWTEQREIGKWKAKSELWG